MWVSLALKADEFTKGLRNASDQAGGFGKNLQRNLGGVFSGLLKTAGLSFAGIGAAATAGLGLAVRSSIQTNAQLETTRLQFETLMGSADKAKEHVAGLFKFAEKTPFETGPIIAASLKLQTFGGVALNTIDNITLLGDAAAATNAPIDELGFWVGRLYSNLQGGQPFGEAAMRLQELAVLSPQARQEMERLQKAGASASEVFGYFQEDLGKFTGAMEKQAGTWSGLVSTLTDKLSLMAADVFAPVFEGAKQGVSDLLALLDDPALLAGLRSVAEDLGEAAEAFIKATSGLLGEISALGLRKQNTEIMQELGLTQREIDKFYREIRARGDYGLVLAGTEILDLEKRVQEQLRIEHGLTISLAESYQALGEARMDGGPEAVANMEALNNVTIDTSRTLSSYWVNVVAAGEHSKLAADRTNHWATGLAALTAHASKAAAELQATTAAAQAYSDAFKAVQGDYTRQLPGADKPLVSPARTYTVTTGGLSADQTALLEDYQEAAAKAQEEIYKLTNGLGTYGLEQEKVNEKVAEAQGELAYYNELMAPLTSVVGQTSTAHRDLAVNLDAVHQGIYKELVQMEGAEQAAVAYAVSVGIMTDAQAEAALKAVLVKQKIEELAIAMMDAINNGTPIQNALADTEAALKQFVAEVEGTYVPTIVRVTADIPTHVAAMKDQLFEEATLAGSGLMTGLQQGVDDNQHLAVEAAQTSGGAVIDAMADALGTRSPSTITHEMGVDLLVGLENGANQQAPLTNGVLKTIGGNITSSLASGITGARNLVQTAIQGITDAIPAWLKEFLQFGSPSKVVIPAGRSIPEGLAAGVRYSAAALEVALNKLVDGAIETLDLSNRLAQLGGGFAAEFQRQVTDPMAAELGSLDAILSEAGQLFDDTMRGLGRDDVFADWADEAQAKTARRQLLELRQTLGTDGDWLGAMQADEALRALDKRNDLNAEYVRQQEKLAALQEAQAQLSFLQSQVDLIQLIAENADKLPADMLHGLSFGLDADPGRLLDAVTAVLQQQGEEISNRLEGSQALGQVLADGLNAPEFIKSLEPAAKMWDGFTGAVQKFAGWLENQKFKLNIKLGKIPAWAVPGSPLPIHIAWQEFADALRRMDFGDELAQYFAGAMTSGDVLRDFMLSLPDDLAVSATELNELVFQHFDAFQEYFAAVTGGEGDLEELLRAFPEKVQPVVEAVGQMLADGESGVQAYVAALMELSEALDATEATLKLAQGVGNVGAGFARRFVETVLEPLKQEVALAQGDVGNRVAQLAVIVARRLGDSYKLPDLANLPYQQAVDQLLALSNALKNTRGVLSPAEAAAEQAAVDAVLNGLIERNKLEREYEQQQQRILALEEQRAQLNFLQQQLDLIKLVTDSGLSAGILAGMQFGLNADAGALMDTMTRVMQQLVIAAQNELQMHSPSKLFRDMGQNVMESMAMGAMERTRALKNSLQQGLDEATGLTIDPRSGPDRRNGGRSIINGGYHVYVYADEEGALEQLQRQARAGRGRLIKVTR